MNFSDDLIDSKLIFFNLGDSLPICKIEFSTTSSSTS